MAKASKSRQRAQQRSVARDTMSEALKEICDNREKEIREDKAHTIISHYRFGLRLLEIEDDPVTYGEDALKQLALAFGVSLRTLQREQKLAESFTEEQITQLTTLRNEATDFTLQWAHFDHVLAKDVKEAQREGFLRQAVTDSLDPKSFLQFLKRRMRRTGGHGRPHVVPKTLQQQLAQIWQMYNTLTSRSAGVWSVNAPGYSVWKTLLELDPTLYTEDLMVELQNCIDQMAEAAIAIAADRESADKLKAVMQGVFDQRAADERALQDAQELVENERAGRRAAEAELATLQRNTSATLEESARAASNNQNRTRRVNAGL